MLKHHVVVLEDCKVTPLAIETKCSTLALLLLLPLNACFCFSLANSHGKGILIVIGYVVDRSANLVFCSGVLAHACSVLSLASSNCIAVVTLSKRGVLLLSHEHVSPLVLTELRSKAGVFHAGGHLRCKRLVYCRVVVRTVGVDAQRRVCRCHAVVVPLQQVFERGGRVLLQLSTTRVGVAKDCC